MVSEKEKTNSGKKKTLKKKKNSTKELKKNKMLFQFSIQVLGR